MPKVYAVKKGKRPGVYNTWAECQEQTKGFSGAVFKSFTSLTDANEFIKEGPSAEEKYDSVFYTDGSCMSSKAGGAAVDTTNQVVYYQAVNTGLQTNNRGELIGIRLALQHSKGSILIHTDSQISINILSMGYTAHENLDLVTEIRQLMKDRIVRFEYVPAHVGIKYNEMADVFAKRAVFTSGSIEKEKI